MATTVTLLYAAHSEGSGYTLISGSPTFTLTGGETLVVLLCGVGQITDFPAPTDSAGTLVKQLTAYNAFFDSATSHGGLYTEFNAAAGSHTITPPVIAGGADGLIGVLKISGMAASLAVRTAVKNRQSTTSTTFSLTTDGTPVAGDVAIGFRTHENNVASTSTVTQPAGWTSLWQFLNGTISLPTDESYLILGSGGALTGTWTTTDAAVTDTSGAILILKPAALITSQPADQTVNLGGIATFSVSATASAGSATFQWQDNSGGGVFANISGETSSTLSIANAVAGQNGRRYQVVVTDSNGSVTSNSAALYVNYPSRAVVPLYDIGALDQIGFQSLLNIGGWFAPNSTVGLLIEKWLAEELDPATGGGNIYSVSASDSVTATDAATDTGVFAATTSDAISATDAATSQATVAAAATDAVSSGDSATSAAVIAAAAADSSAATDSSTAVLALAVSASDAVTTTDAASITAVLALSASDSVTASDAATDQLVAGASASDSVTATDSASAANAVAVAATDSVTATDSATVLVVLSATASDAAAASDSSTATGVFSATASDPVTATDSSAAALIAVAEASDAVSASDSASWDAAAQLTSSDSVSAADAATTQPNIFVSVTESIAAGDSAASQETVDVDAEDSVTAGDSASATLAFQVVASDSVSADDSADALFAFLASVSDAVSATDQASALLALAVSASDALVLTDVATGLSVGAGIDPYDLWNYPIEGSYTAADLFRLMAAVLAGKTTILDLGAGAATVTFEAIDESDTRVTAQMNESVRTTMTLDVLASPAPSSGTSSDPANIWSYLLEGSYSVGQTLRLMAAVLGGKDSIVNLGDQQAHIEFRAVDDSATRVAVDFTQSERTDVVLTP